MPLLDERAEELLLGHILVQPEDLDWLEVSPAHFASPRCRQIFGAIAELRDAGESVNDSSLLRKLGDLSHVARIAAGSLPVAPADAQGYLAELERCRATRCVGSLADALQRGVRDGLSPDELVEVIGEALIEVDSAKNDEMISLPRAFEDRLEEIELAEIGGTHTCIPTGIERLDERVGGLPIGVPSVLGGRPGTGKSSFALSMAMRAAVKGFPSAIFSYEDLERGFAERVIAAFSQRVTTEDVRGNRVDSTERALLRQGMSSLPKLADLRITRAHGQPVERLCRRIVQSIARHGTKLVVVDYIQNIPKPPGVKDRSEAIEENVRRLADLCGKHEIALLLLSQMNRASAEEGRPTLQSFAQSSGIEQLGKLMLALTRDDDGSSPVVDIEVHVLKNHQGGLGSFSVPFDLSHCRVARSRR